MRWRAHTVCFKAFKVFYPGLTSTSIMRSVFVGCIVIFIFMCCLCLFEHLMHCVRSHVGPVVRKVHIGVMLLNGKTASLDMLRKKWRKTQQIFYERLTRLHAINKTIMQMIRRRRVTSQHLHWQMAVPQANLRLMLLSLAALQLASWSNTLWTSRQVILGTSFSKDGLLNPPHT